MIALIKGVIPGAVFAWIVSFLIGSSGSTGGVLAIDDVALAGFDFYWSWPLFLAGTGLSWAIFYMME
jgi:hypothetical protein